MKGHFRVFAAFVVTVSLFASPVRADSPAKSANVAVHLVSEASSIQAGKPFTVAIQMTIAPGWHTYWKNPGDSGVPTRVVWTLPDSFRASGLEWPAPIRAVTAGVGLFGYVRQATFLVEITPPPSLPAGRFTVLAGIKWLECRDICIPGKANLEIALPSATGSAPALPDPSTRSLFAAARASIPRDLPGIKVTYSLKANRLLLRIVGAQALGTSIEFFPEAPGLIDASALQRVSKTGSALEISMKRLPNAAPAPSMIKGLLVAGSGLSRKVYEVSSLAVR